MAQLRDERFGARLLGGVLADAGRMDKLMFLDILLSLGAGWSLGYIVGVAWNRLQASHKEKK
jgi:hypothetical protein